MVLAIIEEFGYRWLTVAYKILPIEVTDEVFRSTSAEETARIYVDYHHPFFLVRVSINWQLEEVRALKLVRLCAISLTESTDISPIPQVR